MTPREMINDLIVSDGYATYRHVFNLTFPTPRIIYPFTHSEYVRRGDFLRFYQHILYKIGRNDREQYAPTFNIEGYVNIYLLVAFIDGLSAEATEEEKVFIMLKYKVTL